MSSSTTRIVAIGAVPVLVITGLFTFLLLLAGSASACNASSTSVTIDPTSVPAGPIAGYSGVQLVNAAYVIKAGSDLQLSVRDQTIGVMTAMGESSLIVVDYGDAAGPDSRGLFQQRANGAWGSYSDRMDPYISSTNFFKALKKIKNRDAMAPTLVAHAVQRNADPYHYTKYWDPAVEVVEALTGTDTGLSTGTGSTTCSTDASSSTTVNDQGWAVPGAGPITSVYGIRKNPVTGVVRLHAGDDLAAGGCNGPIYAAHAGTVTYAGTASGYGHVIMIDHGSGVVTRYGHMYASGLLVHVGDKVTAGQQIAKVGSDGTSTGCHLHFEVRLNGSPTDPVPFMKAVGITLG